MGNRCCHRRRDYHRHDRCGGLRHRLNGVERHVRLHHDAVNCCDRCRRYDGQRSDHLPDCVQYGGQTNDDYHPNGQQRDHLCLYED
jgi:hypothetical protein